VRAVFRDGSHAVRHDDDTTAAEALFHRGILVCLLFHVVTYILPDSKLTPKICIISSRPD
jgi:nitrate reductase gamma subunit